MTNAEQREAARQFINKWNGRGKEDEDDRSYWIDLLQNVLGMDQVTDRIDFQKKVIVPENGKENTKRIDAYIPETRVIIEQKSLGISLNKPGHQSGNIQLTPYEQAKRYNDNLPFDEKARWIVTSNFSEIWIYDMNQRVPAPQKIEISNLQAEYKYLDFLIKKEVKEISKEETVSKEAGEIVGEIYDAFMKQYADPDNIESQKSLNKLCVRLVFLLYAEDSGLLGGHQMFHDYMQQFTPKEWRGKLIELFKLLNTPDRNDPYMDPDLKAFPYVNGGLFADEAIEIPIISDEIVDLILNRASSDFDWSEISPTIFGAVFESTLNPETRRAGGMHYTSPENIHKVIDPLFLDELQEELEQIKGEAVLKTREKKLKTFQEKLSGLKFLDPACGSGNFLTETFLSIRRIENDVIATLQQGQITLADENMSPIKVNINQFYGIEINDFAVTVAKTALWIAEHQMIKETEDIVRMQIDFLPLHTEAKVIEGNALRMDWEDLVSKKELNYIMGNPPFIGARFMNRIQKEDINNVFLGWKNIGNLDYVACWYKKALDYILGSSNIKCAYVSTNSICQGESVPLLWKPLYEMGASINFAYRTFVWNSEASLKAKVHCVIIGFSLDANNSRKILFEEDGKKKIVKNINAYLIEADNIFIEPHKKPLCNVPLIGIGNKPVDGGYYLFTQEEKDQFVSNEPKSEKLFHRWYGAREFINNEVRYCLYLNDCSPSELRSMPKCMEIIESVKNYRLSSTSEGTRKIAQTPTKFHVSNFPVGKYIVIPQVSSQRRRYIPIGYMDDGVLCSDKVRIMADGELYHFGIVTSNVHMAWMRAICCRLKSDYSYTVNDVYNPFPWPSPTEEQKKAIEQTAQGILDARALYPDSSLADLYDELTMPPELRKAHVENDKAVMKAYGFYITEGQKRKFLPEADCVAALMKMYQELTSKEK